MDGVETNSALQANPWGATALQSVIAAAEWVIVAKRTHSTALIAHAEREMQAAVDAARDVNVEWGQIGTALGIARGNAYQRYRKRLSRSDFRPAGVAAGGYREPTS